MTQQLNTDDWQHLKPYGYAPGNYMGPCRVCNEMQMSIDKRAISCRACAEMRYAADHSAQQASQPEAVEKAAPSTYSEWSDFYAGRITEWLTLDGLRAEVAKLATVDAPSPERLLIHAMHLLEAQQAAQPVAMPAVSHDYTLPLRQDRVEKMGGHYWRVIDAEGREVDDATVRTLAVSAQPVAGEPAKAFDAEGFRAWVAKNLPDDTIIGSSAWWADHLTAWAQRFAAPAPAGLVPLTDARIRSMWKGSPFRGSGGQIDWFTEGVRAGIAEFCEVNGIGIKAGKDGAK